MTDNIISREIIGAAIEVHRLLSPGLLESAYEECLSKELALRALKVERQKPVPVVYKDVKLECGYRIDLLVEGRAVVELKSIESLVAIHEADHSHLPSPIGSPLGAFGKLQCGCFEGRDQAVCHLTAEKKRGI
jgi:GxxExxY protein